MGGNRSGVGSCVCGEVSLGGLGEPEGSARPG